MTTEIKTAGDTIGHVNIADEVIAVIAGTAALEIEGVAYMVGNITGDIAEILGKKNLSKGVKVVVNGGEVSISINLCVKFGYKIQDVSVEVQKRIKTAIETMTGLNATEININVTGVQVEKEKARDTSSDEQLL